MNYRFFRFSNRRLVALPAGLVLIDDSGELTGSRFRSTAVFSCCHSAGEGHSISDGRRRRKLALANALRMNAGRSTVDPIAFKNVRRFILSCGLSVRRTGASGLEVPGVLQRATQDELDLPVQAAQVV